MSTMPAQRPGTSEQTVQTPAAFLAAVTSRFGRIGFDLAANPDTTVVGYEFFGPGSRLAEDALATDWPLNRLCWCNPPYRLIKGNGFARKARIEAAKGCQIVMLIPASVATNWFADEIHGRALVIPLRPRLTFVGHEDPYPKDLMLCAYGFGRVGFEPWDWGVSAPQER